MRVYLDTNCVIYFVERNPPWFSKVIAHFARFTDVSVEVLR